MCEYRALEGQTGKGPARLARARRITTHDTPGEGSTVQRSHSCIACLCHFDEATGNQPARLPPTPNPERTRTGARRLGRLGRPPCSEIPAIPVRPVWLSQEHTDHLSFAGHAAQAGWEGSMIPCAPPIHQSTHPHQTRNHQDHTPP